MTFTLKDFLLEKPNKPFTSKPYWWWLIFFLLVIIPLVLILPGFAGKSLIVALISGFTVEYFYLRKKRDIQPPRE